MIKPNQWRKRKKVQPVIYNRDGKFDLQLSQAIIDERRLGEIFIAGDIRKIELKERELAVGADRQHLH